MKKSEKEQLEKVMQRLESGELVDQACWSFIKELNSYSEERLESVAIRDGISGNPGRQKKGGTQMNTPGGKMRYTNLIRAR